LKVRCPVRATFMFWLTREGDFNRFWDGFQVEAGFIRMPCFNCFSEFAGREALSVNIAGYCF